MTFKTNRRTKKRFPTELEVAILGDIRRPGAVDKLLEERTRLENLKLRIKFYDDLQAINDRIEEINELISIYTGKSVYEL